jgi:DNA polymerase-3 subunit theta
MAGQSDYLPPGLPFNRGAWPQEYRDLENLDLQASRLIKNLYARKVTRTDVLDAIEAVPEQHREHFRARLNYWREQRENRGRS